MKSLFKNRHIEVSYDSKNHWIYCNWQNYQTLESIKEGGEQIILHLKKNKCNKILNDNRLVKGTWTFATEWITTNWFPRVIGAGLTHFAWIYSPDVFSKFSTDQVAKSNSNDIIRKFNNIEEGESWLRAVD
ncbi:MAG: hypothetical protein AAGI07_09230 [Bacteroidota bacterium]